MIEKIRRKIGLYYFNKEQLKSRLAHGMVNLPEARRVGILYTLEEAPDYDRVSEFVTELQQDHKEVKALGFVKSKNLIQRFLPKLSYDFFSRKDLTWFYRPIHDTVRNFMDKDFDLLIDLNLADSFPHKYIAGLSRAICRVGRFSEDNTMYYDLMIDVKPAMTIDEYLSQIKHYLTVIKTDEKHPQ
ncbi:MAG: hypothetical protein NTU51_11515 [Bacteroidetes bacterium]|nr:hypothetical protein [Bacteroidota bacterium]